jgi:hypothetical protein
VRLARLGVIIISTPTIIETLIDAVTDFEERTGRCDQLVEFYLARMFLTMVFGEEWARKRLELNPDPDPWMLNGNDAWLVKNPTHSDVHLLVYHFRMVRLADAIFTVLTGDRVTGQEGLRQRFLTRPNTKASFTEAEIASLLVYNGCVVNVVAESGMRGQDFDCLATVGDTPVSVEVTGMSGENLSLKTVMNKLHEKRDQVPADRAAVLYVHIPWDWITGHASAAPIFAEATERFMRRSRRLNAIILISEDVMPHLAGGIPRMAMRPGYNNRPRHPIPDLTVFGFKGSTAGERRCAISLFDRIRAFREKQRAGLGPKSTRTTSG